MKSALPTLPPNATIVINLEDLPSGKTFDPVVEIHNAIELSRQFNCTITLKRGDYASVDLNQTHANDFAYLNEAEELLAKPIPSDNPEHIFISMLSGSAYYPLLGKSCPDVPYEDIAIGLSRTARFNGQTTRFYSVAEHSLYVYQRVCELTDDPEIALKALCHDMSEGFTGDLVSPLKALIPQFKAIENKIDEFITNNLGLAHVDYTLIKRADLELLATEKRDLKPNSNEHWHIIDGIDPLPLKIRALSHEEAFKEFMSAFDTIYSRVQQYRFESIAEVKVATTLIDNGHASTQQGYDQVHQTIAKIFARSPSDEIINNLSEYHAALHNAMLINGINPNDSNALFMGRKQPQHFDGNDSQTSRLCLLMQQCGTVCRQMFERISSDHQAKFFNPVVRSHEQTKELRISELSPGL